MHNADYEDLLIHTRCRCQGQTKASITSIPALAFANQNTKHVILFLKLQSPIPLIAENETENCKR